MKRIFFKLLLSMALLGFFLWRTPLGQIGSHLRQLDAETLAAAIALSLAAWWLSAVRLRCLLPEFRLGEIVRATFVSIFYATVLPGQIAGDVVKAYRLGRQTGRAGHAEAATLIDRALAIFSMFCIGAFAAMLGSVVPVALRVALSLGAVAIVLAGLVAASPHFRTLLIGKMPTPGTGRMRTFLRSFGIALHDCLRRPTRVFFAFLLALAFHVLCIAIQVLLGSALHLSLRWSEWAVVYASVSLVVLLPVSIAGIGLREGGYVGMLALFGVASAAALSLSFTMFALTLVGAALGGWMELLNATRRRDQGIIPP